MKKLLDAFMSLSVWDRTGILVAIVAIEFTVRWLFWRWGYRRGVAATFRLAIRLTAKQRERDAIQS